MATILTSGFYRILCLGLVLVVWSSLPVTAWATDAPANDDPNRVLTRSELETLLESHSNVGLVDGYDGPMPTAAEAAAVLSKVAEVQAQLAVYDASASLSDDGGDTAYTQESNEIKRTCNKHTGLFGRVRFEFWLESDGNYFTDINDFETTFYPAPTLPEIGGIKIESIEGEITDDWNWSSMGGYYWHGGADVEIIYVILEWIEIYRYYTVSCKVRHP